MTVVPVASGPLPAGTGQVRPKNAVDASKQFEALLLAQMLRSAHESADDEDSTASTMFDVAGQQFAQMLADRGGLGLSTMIARSLNRT
jgi:Rod binding domain-containing protein